MKYLSWLEAFLVGASMLLLAIDLYAVYSGDDSYATIHYAIPLMFIYVLIEARK